MVINPNNVEALPSDVVRKVRCFVAVKKSDEGSGVAVKCPFRSFIHVRVVVEVCQVDGGRSADVGTVTRMRKKPVVGHQWGCGESRT